MNKIAKLLFLSAILLTFSIASVWAEKIVEAQIKTNPSCESCKMKIEKAVNKLDGVIKSNLDLESKILTVKYDGDKVNLDIIRAKIRKVGYEADLVDGNTKTEAKKSNKCCDSKLDKK